MSDQGNAAERMAPGAPGTTIKFTFTNASSVLQAIRAAVTGGNISIALYISVKIVTADGTGAHMCFGDVTTLAGNVTNADALFHPADGWQDMMLLPSQNSFKIKGDTVGGDVYIWFSGH